MENKLDRCIASCPPLIIPVPVRLPPPTATAWKAQVGQAIAGLSEIEYQLSGCVAGEDHNGAGFKQALDFLYAESHFPQFLSLEAWRQAGLTDRAGSELETLRQQIDAYDEPDSDTAMMADPAWGAILFQAHKALRLLEE